MGETLSNPEPSRNIGRRSNHLHDLSASLTRLERSVAGMRRRTILFACWGVVMIAATAVRIIVELRLP